MATIITTIFGIHNVSKFKINALHLIIWIALLGYSHLEIDHSQADGNSKAKPAKFRRSDHNRHIPYNTIHLTQFCQ